MVILHIQNIITSAQYLTTLSNQNHRNEEKCQMN